MSVELGVCIRLYGNTSLTRTVSSVMMWGVVSRFRSASGLNRVESFMPNGDLLVPFVLQFEVRQVLDHRCVKIDFTLFPELHDGCGDKELGDRGHVEQ